MSGKTENDTFHVVFLGESGFPYGLAAMQKVILLSKSLIAAGAKVTVINQKGIFDPKGKEHIALEGIHEGIHYIYTSGTIYRPEGFLRRNIAKIKGIIGEFRFLCQLKKKGYLHAGIISSQRFFATLLFRIYSILLGFPVVMIYVEWSSAMQHRRGVLTKINDYLFDNWALKWLDGAFPISEVLTENYRKIAPGRAILKLPVLCDFEPFNLPKRTTEAPYLLYCGAASYKEVIDFILEAFDRTSSELGMELYLIVSGGSESQYNELNEDIQKMKRKAEVKVFSNIPYKELVDLYLHAKGLLIPMRPTLQDAARFPHKIGEYTATGNPIITTNYGEVAHYFEDEKTALIANSYDVSEYARKMEYVIQYPQKAKEIGESGRQLGFREFNYLTYGPQIKDLLEQLYHAKKGQQQELSKEHI